jgi:hypothetical protein
MKEWVSDGYARLFGSQTVRLFVILLSVTKMLRRNIQTCLNDDRVLVESFRRMSIQSGRFTLAFWDEFRGDRISPNVY